MVFLNLAPGVLSVTEVLRVLTRAIPIESVAVMAPPKTDPDPAIWAEVTELLRQAGAPTALHRLDRDAFYQAASTPEVCLTIATGEQRIYANVLVTIGVVPP